jgi:hypothetical protein
MTVTEALIRLARHPVRLIVGRWNWKAAVLSALIRGTIFFAANVRKGFTVALHALVTDAAFRVPLVGVYAAVVQGLVGVEPVWAANVLAAGVVPAVAHTIEISVHWAAGTPAVRAGVTASIAFSVVTGAFELFAMRRGVLVVGAGGGSLPGDVRRLPGLVAAFLVEAAGVVGVRRTPRGPER